MNTYEIILKKRDGFELSGDEIRFIINGFTSGEIPDYQISAFLMAIYFKGMTPIESLNLTMAMTDSGEKIDLTEIKGFKVDKHSTGGVGDTTTLVLAPLVASCGGVVAKMSGRELGHTGGTIDKLESIPGMKVELTRDHFIKILKKTGVSIISQTSNLAPADKQLYALRNVTATVDSIPLIASSIMSKKLASGSEGIVFDVKTGRGAFMQKNEVALMLAQTMVNIGENAGKRIIAIISGMEQPLGKAIGNALEVKEAIDTLKGRGPDDLIELVIELGSNMLVLTGVADSIDKGKEIIEKNLRNGAGLEKLGDLIESQGGKREVIEKTEILPQPRERLKIKSIKSGYVKEIDALGVGLASKQLGAGRQTKDEPIDLSIGIYLEKKVGEWVEKDEPLAIFHSDGDLKKVTPAKKRLLKSYKISDKETDPPKFFYARITKDGVEEF